MPGTLSSEDLDLIKKLREAGVLQPVEGNRLDQAQGVILLTCADGDRFFDIFQYQVRLLIGDTADSRMDSQEEPRIHTLSWHGGALACAPHSPINRRPEAAEIFREQIVDARALKKINTLVLYAHAPCAAAGVAGVSLRRSLELQMAAKKAIGNANAGIKTISFFHVDYGDNHKHTYFFSRDNWEEYSREMRLAGTA